MKEGGGDLGQRKRGGDSRGERGMERGLREEVGEWELSRGLLFIHSIIHLKGNIMPYNVKDKSRNYLD